MSITLQALNKLYLTSMLIELRFTILVVDSGLGGLYIYSVIKHFLPNLHYIYIFDNVAFPYGEKNDKFITERILKILTNAQRLYSINLAVIACNTASTITITLLRNSFSFPIVGTFPALKKALYLTSNGVIGLLATDRTIKCLCVHKFISFYGKKYYIKTLGSSELVKIAEKKIQGELVCLKKIYNILKSWLKISNLPDTIVLGCTHFSFLKTELHNLLPKHINLIDSSLEVAIQVVYILKYRYNLKKDNKTCILKSNIAYCMKLTKKTKRLITVLNKYGFKILKELT